MLSPSGTITYKVLISQAISTFSQWKNTNNKVNRWSLELATYNISFEWISRAKTKAADCLSRLATAASTPINMLTASSNKGPAFHTRSHTQNTLDTTSTPITDTMPHISQEPTPTPKPITTDHLDTLLQMQRTDPFCRCISKRLLNGKAPHHEFDIFTHVKDSYTNTSQMLVRNSSPWLSQNHGSTQY